MAAFEQKITVRWADLDPNGHVRHSAYYDYGAQARVALLEARGLGIGWMTKQMIGPVLFREEARFLRELRMSDVISINVMLGGRSEDNRKWRIVHEIRRGEELCAVVEVEGAWMDLRARKITVPPEELAHAFDDAPKTEDFQLITSGRR
ncbi:MAG TPA: thioesterase family protein [Gammaproteobacteria bacterium]|nr:thioesterase family protein [Gammaproteobacteria bacterium]